jgi:DNA replication and repair protein RecF
VKLETLQLQNFRNHHILSLNTAADLIYIYGNNGMGKTNILEAVFLLSTTKSLRSEYDKDLINHNKNFLRVKGFANLGEENQKELEITIEKRNEFQNTSNKKTYINGVNKSLTTFAGNLKSVIFTPNDLEILTSSPSNRRKYLDSIFYQFNSMYKNSILDYTKSLKQRNKLLELINETGKGKDQLFFWNQKLITEGNNIQKERERFFEYANLHKEKIIEDLQIKNFSIDFIYDKSEISSERFAKYETAEISTKSTLVGPHKDDFEILLNNYKISDFGSRGQQRMGILILKQLEINFLFENTGIRPLLLLDDIFSELDDKNKQAILKIIPYQQTFITSVDLIKEFNYHNSKTYQIEDLLNPFLS